MTDEEYKGLIQSIRNIEQDNDFFNNEIVSKLSIDIQQKLINENFSDETLVWIVSNSSKEIKNNFFMNNNRAKLLYFKFDIVSLIKEGVKFSFDIVNTKKFFELLKSESLIEFRNNIELVQTFNPSVTINSRINIYYEDILKNYNIETDMFTLYDDVIMNKTTLSNFSNDYILSSEVKDMIMNSSDDLSLGTYLKKETSKKVSEIVVDGLFHDNFYNVLLNIKEMIRYSSYLSSEEKLLDDNKIDFYKKILNIDNMSNHEKIKLYNDFKDKKMYSTFYFDLRALKDLSYQKIIDSMVNPLEKSNLLDKEKTNKYGVPMYEFSDEKYAMIVRCSKPFEEENNNYRRNCYTLITDKDNTVFHDYGLVYGYSNIDKQDILHIFEDDSFSYDIWDFGSEYVNRIMTVDQLANIQGYNEIQIVNKKDGNSGYIPLKPDFLVIFDEPDEIQIEESKRLNLPIVILKKRRLTHRESILNELPFDEIDDFYISSINKEMPRRKKR